MNIKSLPHKIAFILLIFGVLITYLGISIMSQDIQVFDSSSPSDGAVPDLFNVIIGGIITLIGGLCTLILLISWAIGALIQLFAKLIQLFGAKPVFITLGVVILLLSIYFFSDLF